jgi:quercetin dioxygenase-like cupin family protein
MKKYEKIGILGCIAMVIAISCFCQDKMLSNPLLIANNIFSQGDKINSENFKGDVYLKTLVVSDSVNHTSIGNVTFEPGARTKWHLHPGGQILLIIDGEGYYQERGQSKRILYKGDVIKCPPNVLHWHGASSDHHLIHVAVTNRHLGETVWLEEVTDEVYGK